MAVVWASDSGHPFEVAEIEAKSMGWQRIDEGVYLHKGSDDTEVVITGQATPI